ncbi:hypothetical protein MRX96_008292 [Rhipicephalus microplus]
MRGDREAHTRGPSEEGKSPRARPRSRADEEDPTSEPGLERGNSAGTAIGNATAGDVCSAPCVSAVADGQRSVDRVPGKRQQAAPPFWTRSSEQQQPESKVLAVAPTAHAADGAPNRKLAASPVFVFRLALFSTGLPWAAAAGRSRTDSLNP